MAFTPIPGGIEGVMHMIDTATGQEVVNVYHFYHVGPPGVVNADVDDTANYLATTLWPVVRVALPAVVQLVECTARDISVVGGYAFTSNANSGQPGTSPGNAAPSHSALAISWRTQATGRRERGRSFIGPTPIAGVVNDRITSGYATTLFSIGSALIGSHPNASVVFAVRSLADVAMKVVTAFVIDTVIDSMHRRLLNRGR